MLKVIFRTGGTANYRWREVLGAFSPFTGEAAAKAAELARMGYPSLIVGVADAALPRTFTGRVS